MHQSALGTLVSHIRQLAARESTAVQSDAELLLRFSAEGDEAAFASLMHRHGGMVWRVCRNALHHDHDAEDAFQATFTVLARRAGSIVKTGSVASWLHGVAHRVALRASRDAALRRAREREGAKTARVEPRSEVDLREALSVVDDELRNLSEKYRAPFVLCYLEGRSVAEASRLMGLKQGTLAVRLSRARGQLRQALAKRGVTLSAALSVVALARSSATASPPAFLLSAVRAKASISGVYAASASVPSARVAFIQGTVNAMSTIAIKPKFALLLALCVLGTGAVLFSRQGRSADPAHLKGEEEPAVPPASVALAADDAKPASEEKQRPVKVADELRAMRGTWTTTTVDRRFINGEPQPPRQLTVTFVIENDKLFMLGQDGFIDEEMTMRLDPNQKPKAVDLVSLTTGTLGGIYQLDGDTLRIQIDPAVGKRPAEFSADGTLMWGVLRRSSRTPAKVEPRFANPSGWFWTVEPKTLGGTMATSGIVVICEKGRDGATRITLASARSDSRPPEHRPVFLDAEKNRYLAAVDGGGSSSRRDGAGVALNRWRMDPKVLPAEKVAMIGIETRTPETRPLSVGPAVERARKAGIEVPSFPVIGKVFDFTLNTTEGKTLRSADLRGKVILIDCWEPTCSPCVDQLGELKELFERSHKDGLEVIGISFDQNSLRFKKAVARYALPWPQVLVPPDGQTQKLWQEATGIDSVPRLLLIDRQGVLRADNPRNLKSEIDKLLKEPSDHSK